MTEQVVQLLSKRLYTVYGISKTKAMAIIDTIKGNPGIALNPMNLFVHIKQLEPRANDYHLWIVINGVFEELKSQGWRGTVPPFPIMQQITSTSTPFQPYYMQPPYPYHTYPQQYPYSYSPSYQPYGFPGAPRSAPQRLEAL